MNTLRLSKKGKKRLNFSKFKRIMQTKMENNQLLYLKRTLKLNAN